LFDELSGIKTHRIQKSPLAFGKKQVECQRALARAADAGDNDEPVARHCQRQILQIVLPRTVNRDVFVELGGQIPSVKHEVTLAQDHNLLKEVPEDELTN